MGQQIWVWTETHTRVGIVLVVGAMATVAAQLEPSSYGIVVAVAVALTAVVALGLDGFAGAAVGLAGAAAVIAVKQLGGIWEAGAFQRSAVQTLALIATGIASGTVGGWLRGSGVAGEVPSVTEALGPAHGSLGLLEPDVGMARLEEEVNRARRHSRNVTIAVFRVQVTETGLRGSALDSIRRTVARLVESRAGEDDVPFVLSDSEIAVILPESQALRAWELAGTVADAATTASVMLREHGGQRPFDDLARIDVGIAVLGEQAETAEGLLDVASRAARSSEPDPETGS